MGREVMVNEALLGILSPDHDANNVKQGVECVVFAWGKFSS